MSNPKCRVCFTESNLCISSTSKRKGKTYRSYICRECNTNRLRAYRKTNLGVEASRRAVATYESKNPVRKSAWRKAQIIPSSPCVECGETPTHRHHPDIKRPLHVIALCPKHHKEVHKQQPSML